MTEKNWIKSITRARNKARAFDLSPDGKCEQCGSLVHKVGENTVVSADLAYVAALEGELMLLEGRLDAMTMTGNRLARLALAAGHTHEASDWNEKTR
jgi:hypothetical protein